MDWISKVCLYFRRQSQSFSVHRCVSKVFAFITFYIYLKIKQILQYITLCNITLWSSPLPAGIRASDTLRKPSFHRDLRLVRTRCCESGPAEGGKPRVADSQRDVTFLMFVGSYLANFFVMLLVLETVPIPGQFLSFIMNLFLEKTKMRRSSRCPPQL